MVNKPTAEDTWLTRTDDGVVADGPVEVSCIILSAAAADATVVLYDGETASGNAITITAIAKTTTVVPFPKPIPFSSGMYADLTGSGASLTVAKTNS